MTIIGLAIVIAFIVFSTAKLKWHPFLVLVLAAFLTAFFYGMPLPKIADTVGTGSAASWAALAWSSCSAPSSDW